MSEHVATAAGFRQLQFVHHFSLDGFLRILHGKVDDVVVILALAVALLQFAATDFS
jgi:hypothetical protein